MNTLVMNTLSLAVTEYDWAFQSITPTHAGDVTGLYQLGGADDDGTAISAHFVTGATLWDASLKKRPELVYFSMVGDDGELIVRGKSAEYRYPVVVRVSGQSRGVPGKGIYENYMAFGFANLAGGAFVIDRVEAKVNSSTNRRAA